MLAVQVLSDSTRDPDTTLSRHVLELADGGYREAAVVRGEQAYEARRPFDVTVVPADLLR